MQTRNLALQITDRRGNSSMVAITSTEVQLCGAFHRHAAAPRQPCPSYAIVVVVLRGDLPVELLGVAEDGIGLAEQHREHARRVPLVQ